MMNPYQISINDSYRGPNFREETPLKESHELLSHPDVKRLYEYGPDNPAWAYEKAYGLAPYDRFYLQVPAHEIDPDEKRAAYQRVEDYLKDTYGAPKVNYLGDTGIVGLAQYLGIHKGENLDQIVRAMSQVLPVLTPLIIGLLYSMARQEVPRAEVACQTDGDWLITPRESGLSAPYCQTDPTLQYVIGQELFTDPIVTNQSAIDAAKAHNVPLFWKAALLALSTAPAYTLGNSYLAQKLRGLIGDKESESVIKRWFALTDEASKLFHSTRNYGQYRYAIFQLEK